MDEITLPLELKCRISGKKVVYTSLEYVQKRLAKYGGSLAKMQAEFVCRDAKRLVKEGKNVDAIKIELGIEESTTVITENGAEITIGAEALIEQIHAAGKPTYDYSKISFKLGVPEPITQGAVDQCYNPGWFINKKDCGACAFTKMCNYARKRDTAVAHK